MAKSYPDIVLTPQWVDLAATYPAIIGQRVTLQSKGGDYNYVYFGGAAVPGAREGIIVPDGQSICGAADHIWVKGKGEIALRADASPASVWPNGAVAQDMLDFGEVNIQVSGLAAGDVITVSTSQDGLAYAAESGVRRSDLALVATITANGTYSFGGRALFKWARTGGGAAPGVVIRGSN